MKQAVILAAGEGQRLRPFTVTKPKVMLAIAGKPILQYVVESLAQNGIRKIIIVVGYRREQIFDYIGNGERYGVDINYITQEKQLGTAHALTQVKGIVENEFLVLPGDNLIEAATIAGFVSMEPDAVLVKKVDDTTRYGVVSVEENIVKSIIEKPRDATGDVVNTGIYAFSRGIFDFIQDQLDIPDVINSMLNQGVNVTAQEAKGTWLDVVYPWDILRLNDVVLSHTSASIGGIIEAGAQVKGRVLVGRDTVIRSNSYIMGPAVIGENCDIGPNVCILPATSIGNNVVVSPFTEIENSVIGSDVNIGPGSIIQDSVIDDGCNIKGHFSASSGETEVKVDNEHHLVKVGAMLGASCDRGNNVVAQPGVVVGNYSQVRALKLISGRLPDKSLVL